ncbi:MAG: sodium:solute symporter [Acidobacteria bacterium]|nr:sodium:solute symporter [Acidobacteriota bacterium]
MGGPDLAVLALYLVGTLWLGLRFAGPQRNIDDYLRNGRRAPWWVLTASIVATETSTVTVISIPGFAFGTDLTFLQLVIGYLVGRVVVTVVLLPRYFAGDYLTAYQILTERFGSGVGRLAAGVFLITRNLADGFRLFGAGLVLGAVLLTLPGASSLATVIVPGSAPATTLLVVGVVLLGTITIIYTWLGGMSAVLWTDLLQLTVYVGGSVIAALILLGLIPGGWMEIGEVAGSAGRLRLIDLSWSLDRSYTLWSGIIGGAFLTLATHGTDQLLVQRYLCTRSANDAGRALLWSGVLILLQFTLFLLIGVMMFVYYTTYAPDALSVLGAAGSVPPDRVFPHFIVTELPAGVRGIMVAAILAAAMSTLSSSLSASASTTLADFYLPTRRQEHTPAHDLRVAQWSTLVWGVVQLTVALAAISISDRIIDEVLGISSFTGGLILGLFLLGVAGYRRRATAYAGVAGGLAVMLGIRLLTTVSWQWYVLLGATATILTGWLIDRFLGDETIDTH